jgi:nickel-type superoxide dismutase maturation protease
MSRTATRWGRWAAGAAGLGVALVIGALGRVEVLGESMTPTLLPGDHLLVVRVPWWWPLRPGELVALWPSGADHLMVKRVAQVGPDGVVVHGDNARHSTDSRSFGPVPASAIVGRVLYRYAPAARTGVPR